MTSAEMPTGSQYRRIISPAGVPRPTEVRTAFSSGVIMAVLDLSGD